MLVYNIFMPIVNKKLQKKILAMAEADQAARKLAMNDSQNKELCNKVYRIDCKNRLILKKIIAEFGWPTFSFVGKRASNGFWLLVQHADNDLEFQKQCLELLIIAAKQGQAHLKCVAYLTDRVRMADGKKIKFGTQYSTNNGEPIIRPVINPKGLDRLRQEYGMSTIAEQTVRLKKQCAKFFKDARLRANSSGIKH